MTYYSQFGQDRAVREEFFPAAQFGSFVDIGAGDGVTDSNTLHFEEAGWRGLLVEADPEVASITADRRSSPVENVACANRSGTMVFQKVPVPGWSGLAEFPHMLNALDIARMNEAGEVRYFEVTVVPLQELLDRHGIRKVDYLSLDVEGAELSVLESIAWARTEIRVLSVEILRTDGAIYQYLAERGYALWAKLGSDEIYVLKPWLLGRIGG